MTCDRQQINEIPEARRMAQSLKCFLHKHEELSTSTTWQEEAGRGISHLQIPVMAVGERMIPVHTGQLVSTWFSKRAGIKTQGEE